MKINLIICFSILLLTTLNSIAQTEEKIIKLYEVSADKKNQIEIKNNGLHIVDINSSIHISLNKDSLIHTATNYLNTGTESKLKELEKYNRLLHNIDTLLSLTNKALRASEFNEEALNKLLSALEVFYDELMKDTELVNEIELRWNEYTEGNGKDAFDIFVMNYLVGKRNTLAASIDSVFKHNRIQFSIVAYRVDPSNTRIHVENYDDMSIDRKSVV